jgi:hypothetical protein
MLELQSHIDTIITLSMKHVFRTGCIEYKPTQVSNIQWDFEQDFKYLAVKSYKSWYELTHLLSFCYIYLTPQMTHIKWKETS